MRSEEEVFDKLDEIQSKLEGDGDYRELTAMMNALDWVIELRDEL